MEQIIDSNNRKFALNVSIKCQGKCIFNVIAEDLKPNSKYARRTIIVDGFRTIYIPFVVSPKKIRVRVELVQHSTPAREFVVGIEETDLIQYNVFLDDNTNTFMSLLVPTAQVMGFYPLEGKSKIFTKDKFRIKLMPRITDYTTGQVLNTPARIGHKSGIIENSQEKMARYTFLERIMIDLHEFCHKWKNPNMGLPVEHEVGADINALYIYLGLGFSKVEAIHVFAKVFYAAQTDANIYRMRKIMDYIRRFENEEFAKKLTL